MPAPTTKQLYNFKGNFRAACKSINTAAGLSAAYEERATAFVSQRARVETSFDLGEAVNQETRLDGTRVYDSYTGRLRFRVSTARREDQASVVSGIVDLHEEFLATIMAAYEERLQPFSSALLPYYVVKTIRPLGTRSDLNIATWEDFTDVEFQIEFDIRSTAFPS